MKFHTLYRRAIRVSSRLLQDPAKILKLIRQAQQKTGTTGSKGHEAMEKQVPFWKERIQLLSRMLKAYVEGYYTPGSYQFLVRSVAALVYFLWIFDLIPDVIPFLGYVDDATLLAWVLGAVNEELNRFQAWEEQNDPPNAN